MTFEDAVAKMEEIAERGGEHGGDMEMDHVEADNLLCDFLIERGYGGLVDVYRRIDKWFA